MSPMRNPIHAARELAARRALRIQIERELSLRKLASYAPYQKQRDFHHAGAQYRERLFRAGNQTGKTTSGAAEMATHLTGRYPPWWTGKRFKRPIAAWAASVTSELTRDGVQRILLGRPGEIGTGMIPLDDIKTVSTKRGIANAIDTVVVKYSTGGQSTLTFKSYEQGREKFQAETLEVVWFDEEPPLPIYIEGVTRTNNTKGIVYLTFTPLLGMSEVVARFLLESNEDRIDINMTIADVEHYTEAERRKIANSYPAFEREARAMGVPSLGSGKIFPVEESAITLEPFPIPHHWPRINGIDFGWDHPTAAVQCAWDRDEDCWYVTHAYRRKEEVPQVHAAAIQTWGPWVPTAWPHDGLQHDKGSGEQLAAQYKKHGLVMLREQATFEDGSNGVEAGIMDMLERMKTGRFKVFRHLNDWFDEFRLYHRKGGRIVKERDDLISATRYALMMRRKAIVKPSARNPVTTTSWDPLDASVGY